MGDTWKPCVTLLSEDQLGGRKGNQFDGGGEQNRTKKKRKREKRKKRKRKERKRRRKGGGSTALPPFSDVRRTKE